MCSRSGISESAPALQNLLARAGGIRGLVSTALPVAAFVPSSALYGLLPASVAALTAAAPVLVWQLARAESTRHPVPGCPCGAVRGRRLDRRAE